MRAGEDRRFSEKRTDVRAWISAFQNTKRTEQVPKPDLSVIAPRALATSGRRPGVRAKRAARGVAGRQFWGQAGARKPRTHL